MKKEENIQRKKIHFYFIKIAQIKKLHFYFPTQYFNALQRNIIHIFKITILRFEQLL